MKSEAECLRQENLRLIKELDSLRRKHQRSVDLWEACRQNYITKIEALKNRNEFLEARDYTPKKRGW